jgi:hypothetical protein
VAVEGDARPYTGSTEVRTVGAEPEENMKSGDCFGLATLTALLLLLPGGTSSHAQAQTIAPGQATQQRYLLLVTFYDLAGVGRIAGLNASPFDGIAVPVVDSYYSGPSPSFEQIESNFAVLQKQTQRQLWPWVFINRMVGSDGSNTQANSPEFRKIKILDLDDIAGAQGAFLSLWRSALREARAAKIPGVVLDMEFYNNYAAYSVANVARWRGVPVNEVESALRQVGGRMAQVACEEFPDAIIWTLFSGLSPARYVLNISEQDSTSRYILLGMMDEIRQHHAGMTLIDGGEDSLGYCHKSAVALGEDISARHERFMTLLQEDVGTLELGGTIALWRDGVRRDDWLLSGRCGASDVKQPQEFAPYLKLLFQNYRFVWIYAPIAGHWDPLNPDESVLLNRVLLDAKANAQKVAIGK